MYGRRTARFEIEPFDYRAAAEFFLGYATQDRLRSFGIFGGLPGHLALLDPERSLEQNVAEQLLSSSGRLVDEAQHFLDAFLGDAQVHYSIIDAVAQGERTWQGITKRVGRDGGSLSRAVQWLMGMGVLEKVVPITEKNAAKSKRGVYRISDPYIAFWHRFVSPMVSAGMIGLSSGTRLWQHRVAPRLDDHMGPVFESVCRGFVAGSNALPFVPLHVGEWWDASSDNEIDVVAVGPTGELLLGECKWGTVDRADLTLLQSRADLITRELSGVRQVYFALFSARGLAADARAAVDRDEAMFFDAAALYAV